MHLKETSQTKDYLISDGEYVFPIIRTIMILEHIKDLQYFTIYDDDIRKYLVYKKIIRFQPSGLGEMRRQSKIDEFVEELKIMLSKIV